jgi:transcription factor S
MPFCPNDKSILYPVDGKLTCRKCGYVHGAPPESRTLKTHEAQERELLILDEAALERLEVMPKIAADCPNCGNREAWYRTQQTRKSDEPETMFLRCTKCDHRWRKY